MWCWCNGGVDHIEIEWTRTMKSGSKALVSPAMFREVCSFPLNIGICGVQRFKGKHWYLWRAEVQGYRKRIISRVFQVLGSARMT